MTLRPSFPQVYKKLLRSFEELSVELFGQRMGVFVELNIIIFCFGSAVAYTIALGDHLWAVPIHRL